MRMMSVFGLTAALATAGRPELPKPILCAYTGWFAPNDDEHDFDAWAKRNLDPLQAARFNTFSPKIQALHRKPAFDLRKPAQLGRMKQLADACTARDLTLVTYVYTAVRKRDPKRHAKLPAIVTSDGSVLAHRFSLYHWPAWRLLLDHAYQIAEASRTLPIAAVGVDLELLMPSPISYDDEAWGAFCGGSGLAEQTPAAERHALLKARRKGRDYEVFWDRRLAEIAQRYERELHAINPRLSLGVMPAKLGEYFCRAFVRHLGTAEAPAIIDSWGMYNGTGLTKEVLRFQATVREMNPHNLLVGWFRPDNYNAGDMRVQAYHAAMKLAGYNNWHIGMFTDEKCNLRVGAEFTLAEYQDAFRQANEAARRDRAAGAPATSIPWVDVTARVTNVDVKAACAMPVPDLGPAGSGAGQPQWIYTRETRRLYFWGAAGEELKIEIRHVAGSRRATSIEYLVLSPSRQILRHEAVSPGEHTRFSVLAPATGVYSLHIAGALAGPWYGVLIGAKHMAIPATSRKDPARFFFGCDTPYLATAWVTRRAPGAAHARIATGDGQMVEAVAGDGTALARAGSAPASLPLPAAPAPVRIDFRRPAKLPDGLYSQLVLCWLEGAAVHPYLSDGPERRLIPKPEAD